MERLSVKQAQPYIIMICILLFGAVFSLFRQPPADIVKGFLSISMTRGVLITDYIEIGGIGAALMNGVIICAITMALLLKLKIIPDGATVMAMFLTFGFSMFGKNILNMIPITIGVWLYAKAVKKPFSDYYLTALLAATISPITSEIIFLDIYNLPVNLLGGVLLGTLAGFLFPMITNFLSRVHRGYNLYNMGFVGGLLATFINAFLTSFNIHVEPSFYVSDGNNGSLSVFLYIISVFLILCGVVLGDRKKIFTDFRSLIKTTGRIPSDYYSSFGANIYINMGMLCALSTTLILVLGAELNGPTIAGILTITGFGAYGKHLRNVVPLLAGAIIATNVNHWNPIYPTNVMTILFCTGLSPIAGKYGIGWGMLAGFLHVCMAHHIGYLSSGMNLYGNGFAAGFVAIMLLPIIDGVTQIWDSNKQFIGFFRGGGSDD